MKTDEEKKNRRIGMITSIGIHILLLVLFIFIAAWRQQIPPPEPIGMSINFGSSETGTGNVQPLAQEDLPVPTEQTELEETKPVEESIPEEVKEIVEEATDQVADVVQKEGPVVVEEKKEIVKPVEEKEKLEETKQVVEEKIVEEKQEERKLEAVYAGPKSDKTNTETSEGTKDNTTGDQGSEQGALDSRTQYGGPGSGGGGFSHNLTGWGTDFRLPDDKPEAEGVLAFKIRIDDHGDIISIVFEKRIGNTEAENFYRDYIQKNMRFDRTASGDIPPYSEGSIQLNLKVK